MDHWAKAPMRREQIHLFTPTLDSLISDDHPVRLLDEILRAKTGRPGSSSTMAAWGSRRFRHG